MTLEETCEVLVSWFCELRNNGNGPCAIQRYTCFLLYDEMRVNRLRSRLAPGTHPSEESLRRFHEANQAEVRVILEYFDAIKQCLRP